jgi:hypothetical protein
MKAPDIRKVLVQEYSSQENTILHELTFPTNQTIADFLVVNDCINGFEIKSDVDTFVRLPKQIEGYDSICQYNWIVIGESKRKDIENHIPAYWGIIMVFTKDRQNEICILRKAKQNTQWSYKNLLYFLPSLNLKRFAKRIPEMLEAHNYSKSLIQKMTKENIIDEITVLSTFENIKEQIMTEVIEYLKSSELSEKRELLASVNKQIHTVENEDKLREQEYRLHSFEYLNEEIKHLKAKKKAREKSPRAIDLMTNFDYLLRGLNKQYLPLCLEYNRNGIHLGRFEFEEESDRIKLIVDDKKDYLVVQESQELWAVLFESIKNAYTLTKVKMVLKELRSES